MSQLMHKLVKIEDEPTRQKGAFWLLAFVLPKNSESGWDLIIAAPWLDSGIASLEYFTSLLKSHLSDKEIRQIARVVIFDKFSMTLKRPFREMHK